MFDKDIFTVKSPSLLKMKKCSLLTFFFQGLTSIWTYALGLAPFKDTFWTVPTQPGNQYGKDRYEAYHDLEALMATLSTGTVGISDKIGLANMTLINK